MGAVHHLGDWHRAVHSCEAVSPVSLPTDLDPLKVIEDGVQLLAAKAIAWRLELELLRAENERLKSLAECLRDRSFVRRRVEEQQTYLRELEARKHRLSSAQFKDYLASALHQLTKFQDALELLK